MCVIARFESIK